MGFYSHLFGQYHLYQAKHSGLEIGREIFVLFVLKPSRMTWTFFNKMDKVWQLWGGDVASFVSLSRQDTLVDLGVMTYLSTVVLLEKRIAIL